MDAGRQDPPDEAAPIPGQRYDRGLPPGDAEVPVVSTRYRSAILGEVVRSIVLILVVLAILITPLIGILQGIPTEEFASYIAPVTGLAGTVVGYWFGQSTDRTR